MKRYLATVNAAAIASGARDRHRLAGRNNTGGGTCADHGRDAQLARNNGGVASASAAVGDDGRSGFHHRLPIRRGGVGNQHFAGLELAEAGNVGNDMRTTGGNLLAHRTAADEHLTMTVEDKNLQGSRLVLRSNRFGPRLNNIKLSIEPVLSPFHIHGITVMGLDLERIAGQFKHIRIAETKALAIRFGRGYIACGATGFPLDIDHLHRLVAETTAQHGTVTSQKSRLMDVEFVRIDSALHHILSQAPGAGDKNRIAETRFGVERKHHAGGGEIGAHHLHHANGKRHLKVIEAMFDAIVDGAISKQAGKTASAGIDQILLAPHIKIGILLTSEARRGQVLGGS